MENDNVIMIRGNKGNSVYNKDYVKAKSQEMINHLSSTGSVLLRCIGASSLHNASLIFIRANEEWKKNNTKKLYIQEYFKILDLGNGVEKTAIIKEIIAI